MKNIEIILIGVVALILFIDFVLRGIKKKKIKEDVERIGKKQSKGILKLGYFIKRPKNIVIFIVGVFFFKILFHYFLYPEYHYYSLRLRKLDGNLPPKTKKSFSFYIENLFIHDLWLFIPTILFLFLFVWYFNDKIKAR